MRVRLSSTIAVVPASSPSWTRKKDFTMKIVDWWPRATRSSATSSARALTKASGAAGRPRSGALRTSTRSTARHRRSRRCSRRRPRQGEAPSERFQAATATPLALERLEQARLALDADVAGIAEGQGDDRRRRPGRRSIAPRPAIPSRPGSCPSRDRRSAPRCTSRRSAGAGRAGDALPRSRAHAHRPQEDRKTTIEGVDRASEHGRLSCDRPTQRSCTTLDG